MRLSVVITAYNEQENIGDCLESLKGLNCEIVVVDNSSDDKTKKIAEKYTKKVFEQKNDPKRIDIQKNFGFSKTAGDWILSLDADERVTLELKKEIESKIKNQESEIIGYEIPRKNIIFGKWIKSDMWWPDYQLRLFRRGKGAFDKNQVHKALKVEGETGKLENFLIHNNYTSINQYLGKLSNYTDIEAENLFSQRHKFNWADSIRFPVNDFVKTFFLQKGFKDGIHGLVLSMLQAFYMGIVFAKLWEKEGFKEVETRNFLREIIAEFKESRNKVVYWVTSSLIEEAKNPFTKLGLRIKRKIALKKIKNS